MIDSATLNAYPAHNAAETHARPRLHMRRDPDDRMAGSIPVWQSPARQTQEATAPSDNFDAAMNYAQTEPAAAANPITYEEPEEFGFGDLIDIVNPLHHIPLVNHVYESVTGDTIKPSSRIIGGAIFGGVAGAAAGIANVIVEEETGKDITGNAVAFVTKGDLPSAKPQNMSPEQQLDQAAQLAFNNQDYAVPQSAMAFGPQHAAPAPEPASSRHFSFDDDDRMAGMAARRKSHTSPLPQTALADPASINLAAIRAGQMTAVTEVKLSPRYNE